MGYTIKPGAFEEVIALFVVRLPAFREMNSGQIASKLRVHFERHPLELTDDNPEDVAVHVLVALGMTPKAARNAVKVAPEMRAKNRRRG